jgi:hypothetical protein
LRISRRKSLRRVQPAGRTDLIAPTWPIHIDELRRASATVSAPLIAGLIRIVIGALKELLIGR